MEEDIITVEEDIITVEKKKDHRKTTQKAHPLSGESN